MTRGDRQRRLTGLLFISPWLAGFLVFTLYPVASSCYYSFCDYDVLSGPVWVGTLNFREMAGDAVFWQALGNTAVFAAFALPLGLALSLLIAVLLNAGIRGQGAYRLLYFLPSLVPLVATAMIWLWIFNGHFGLLNHALGRIGISGPDWLADPHWTKPALILTVLWGVGNAVVIYLAALQDVPRQLYESAQIDGAGALRQLWHITLPMISPVIYFNLVMGIIGSLQVFAQPYIMMRNGGPGRSALFYAVYLFENAFRYHRMGYACAMAWILFLLIVGLTWAATCATRRHIHYGGA
jgi:multiple sugar transport system permease protein